MIKLLRRVFDQPRGGKLVSFSPGVEGDAERFAEYYKDRPGNIQRLVDKGYVETEQKSDVEQEGPKAPRRSAKPKAKAPAK